MNNSIKKELEKYLRLELYHAGEYLRKCILKKMEEVFIKNPKVYERTGQLKDSLKIENIADIVVKDNKLQVKVYFDENAWHNSGNQIRGWNGNGQQIHMGYYLNYGYKVKEDVWFKGIENFGYRKPTYFVEKGIDLFNKSNKWGMYINKDTDIIVSNRSDFIR